MAHGDHPQPPSESFSTLIHSIFPQKRNRKAQPGLVSTVEKEKRTREHDVTKDRRARDRETLKQEGEALKGEKEGVLRKGGGSLMETT